MAKAEALIWSLIFIVLWIFPARSQNITISAAEYFIDVEPGEGSGTPLPAKDGSFDQSTENAEVTINTAGLSVGAHTIFVRMKDSKGIWGPRRATRFIAQTPSNRYIAAAEYFIDTDPGRGNGIAILPFDGSFDGMEERVQATINSTGFSPGQHTLFVRLKDSEGNWGPKRGISFKIGDTSGPLPNCLAAAEYFVDHDPGKGSGIPLIAKDGAFDAASEEVEGTVNTTGFSIGDHLVYVRLRDSQGKWSDPDSELVTVLWASSAENSANNAIPAKFGLFQNYPNPFNAATRIHYELPQKATAKVTIHDVNGRLVAILVNEEKLPGRYDLVWQPEGLASGEYFCRFKAASFQQVRKIILVR